MILSLVALLSGLLNLSSQILYQKIVSITLGDLYTTFLLVTLTFISGTAIGSLLSVKMRRFLPWIEIGTGLYNLLLLFLLSSEFYKTQLPQILVIAGLLIPALSLGLQLPLYSYYLRKIRFNFIYAVYHGGAILGLVAFEIYFTYGLSVKASLFALGSAQVMLGLALAALLKKHTFQIETHPTVTWKQFANKPFLGVSLSVFLISLLSSYQVFWALKTQIMLTESFRLHATLISAAVFFWMTAAGFSEKYLEQIPKTVLFLVWGFGLLSLQLAFPYWPSFITDHFTGELANYFFYSSVLAISLTFPVFISSLVFIKGTQELSKKLPVDQSSGFLNACACLGNIFGMIVAALLASHLWERLFFGTALVVLFAGTLFIAKQERQNKEASYGIVALVLFALIALHHEQASHLFNNRFAKENRSSKITSEVHSDAFSSIAILEDPFDESGLARHYIVDGHRSHNIERGTENLVGLMGRRYFSHPPKKSMVIGVGTGQTSWGVTAISEKTDLVEISPTVLHHLKLFKNYNNDLANDPRAKVNLVDGMTFLKECPAGGYDLIVNTATYPGNFNAAKLYTTEFVALAKKCLTENGVYETYFDNSTVTSLQELADFLAPIQRHFKYIDVITGNYPILMAYNHERPLTTGGWEKFLSESDAQFYEQRLKNKSSFNLDCNQMYRKIPLYQGGTMNTLDQSVLEATSIRNIIKANYQKTFSLFMDYSGLPFSTDCF